MNLFSTDCNFQLIEKAGSILAAHGMKKEAKEIHQKASVEGYDIHIVLKLLKEYMTI
jgi:hypothetical protein